MARYMDPSLIPPKPAMRWLMNPDGRAVQVYGEEVIDERTQRPAIDPKTRRIICLSGTTPEFEKALIGEGGWRFATEDEIAAQQLTNEQIAAKAQTQVEMDLQARLLRAGLDTRKGRK